MYTDVLCGSDQLPRSSPNGTWRCTDKPRDQHTSVQSQPFSFRTLLATEWSSISFVPMSSYVTNWNRRSFEKGVLAGTWTPFSTHKKTIPNILRFLAHHLESNVMISLLSMIAGIPSDRDRRSERGERIFTYFHSPHSFSTVFLCVSGRVVFFSTSYCDFTPLY